MKGASKLSNKANIIIDDVKRTETSIDQFINKYCDNGKITVDDLLGMYDEGSDERKFIQKYAETNLAYSGTIISISAYILAIVAILITLFLYLYDILEIQHILIFGLIALIVIFMMVLYGSAFLNTFPKLERNKYIIMSIEDKWKNQDESHSNSNTTKGEDDDTMMKNDCKTGIICWIIGALLVMVTMIVIYLMGINYKLSSDDATPILTFILVAVTARYAWSTHAIAKQDADRERIAFLERRLEKFYAPMLFFLDFLGGMFLNHENKPAKIEDDPGMQIFTDGKLSTDNRKTCNEKLDEIIQFGYLAKSDVQQSLPDMRSLIIADYYEDNQYQLTIKSLRDKIKRDIDEYTKELKCLVKEE